MISASELADLQADAATLFDVSIAIQRNAPTRGPTSNVIDSYTTASTVMGNVTQPTAGDLANYAYAIANVAAWKVRMPPTADVKIGDQLVIAGQTMQVQVVLNPQSYSTSTRVLATEIKRT